MYINYVAKACLFTAVFSQLYLPLASFEVRRITLTALQLQKERLPQLCVIAFSLNRHVDIPSGEELIAFIAPSVIINTACLPECLLVIFPPPMYWE